MKFKINTKVFPDGRIEQELVDLQGRIAREVMDTKDQQVRQALISLGWTPPGGTRKEKC